MLPFSKDKFFTFITRNSLQVYDPESKLLGELPLTDLVDNLEVINPDKLTQFISQFIEKLSINKLSFIIFISDLITYQKNFPKSDNLDSEIEDYLNKIPHLKPNLTYNLIEAADFVTIIVVNKEIYQSVINGLLLQECKVTLVLPTSIFINQENLSALQGINLDEVLKDKDLVRKANFLEQNSNINKLLTPQIKSNRAQNKVGNIDPSKNHLTFYLIIFFLVIGLAVGGYAYYVFYRNNPNLNKTTKVIKNQVKTASSLQQETTNSGEQKQDNNQAIPLNKDSLKIQILNGTGKTGDAVKVRDVLSALGYKNFELGDADSLDYKETTISYNPSVPADLVKEIMDKLRESFTMQIVEAPDEPESFDLRIITGI